MDFKERQQELLASENERWLNHLEEVGKEERRKAIELANHVWEPPRGLERNPGESTRAYALRIRKEAEMGSEPARHEWMRMRGSLNDGRSWTNIDEFGVIKDGFEYDPAEESANEFERRRLGE